MTLQFYIQDTRSLLFDQAALFTTDAQLTRWINTARSDIAKATGCIQRLVTGQSAQGASSQPGNIIVGGMQPGALPGNVAPVFPGVAQNGFSTINNVERYPYQGFINPFLRAQYAGIKGVIDTIQFSVQWETTFQPALMWMPWDDFQAYCRSYSNLTTSFPAVWTIFNDGEYGEVWLFPVPSSPCIMSANVACVPIPVYSDDDFDAIPDEFREVVKFRAAELAMLGSRRYQEAQIMQQYYAQGLGANTLARDRGRVANYYPTVI